MVATGRIGGYITEQTSTCSTLITPHFTFIAIKPGVTFVSLQSPGYGNLELRSAPAVCHDAATSAVLDSCFRVSAKTWRHCLVASASSPSERPFGDGCGLRLNSYKGLMPK